jgi:hypothetical protein
MNRVAVWTMLGCLAAGGVVACGGGGVTPVLRGGKTSPAGFKVPDVPMKSSSARGRAR